MGNTTATENLTCDDNTSSLQLPAQAVIFAPLFFMQLFVSLVSNLLLLTLLIKASSVQNNINVYLYSMVVNNLVSLVPILLLLVTTVVRQWVFGETMCTVTQALVYMVRVPYILLHIFISRERYKAVLFFFKWKPYTRWTHLQMAVMWAIAVGSGAIAVIQGDQVSGKKQKDVISCYIPDVLVSDQPYLFSGLIVQLVVSFLFNTSSALFCVFHYGYIFRKLYTLKKLHRQDSTNINLCTNSPIDWSAEVTTLKSMVAIFVVSLTSVVATMVYYTSVVAVVMIRHSNFGTESVPLVFLPLICVNFLPCLSPVVLLVLNKRFRTRIKDLFHWRLTPNTAHSHIHNQGVSHILNQGVNSQNKSSRLSKCYHQEPQLETASTTAVVLQDIRHNGESE